MNDDSFLQKEIIKRIMLNCGINSDNKPKHFGLLSEELLSKMTLTLEYDNGTRQQHAIFAGELSLQQSKLRAIVVDLTTDVKFPEYCLVFRLDELPIHGLQLSFDNDDTGFFKVKLGAGWVSASIKTQALALHGMEQISSLGSFWSVALEVEDLYQAACILCTV